MALQNITGKIKKCGAYELDKPKPSPFDDGKTFTHRLAIQMDDDNWYGVGDTDKDNYWVKDPNTDEWVVLGAGSEVLLQYTVSDCGKYRNLKKSNVTVLNLKPGKEFKPKDESTNNSGAKQTFDLTGIKVGHAINAAMLLGNDDYKAPADILEVACSLHDISAKVESKYKELNPSMSARDIGAASGHAVLNACKLTNDIDKVGSLSMQLLTKLVPAVTAYVKGEKAENISSKKDAPKEKVEKKEEAKVAPTKTTKPEPEEDKEPPKEEAAVSFKDMDDTDF